MPIISLLTDFGLTDPYVGVMKGVILQTIPDAQIVDLTHDVPAQDVQAAAYLLASAWRYFPAGTVHCCVVDPGVGTDRKILGARVGGHTFVAPDNGLLSMVLADREPELLIDIENRGQFLKSISQTFHGRDIFAPTAAVLAKGVPLAELGHPLDGPVTLDLPAPELDDAGRATAGQIIYIDHFGNLVTNIRGPQLPWRPIVRLGDHAIDHLVKNYTDAPPGEPLALIGSTGRLEISVNQGHAAEHFDASVGDAVTVEAGATKFDEE